MFESGHKSLLLTGYGMVTLIVLIFDMYFLQWIFPGLFKESRWFIISEIIYLGWIVISIGAGNYLYSVLFSIVPWSGVYGFLVFITFTFAVAIIPILGVIVVTHNYMLRKNLLGAEEVTRLIEAKKEGQQEKKLIEIFSDSGTQSIKTTAFQLLCIESEGNYVNTWCIEDGKIVRHNIRNTLKNIEDQLKGANGLFRCHRAYIVNLRYIEKAEGNSQGYRIQLKFLQKEIPVSRNYTKEFNHALRNWK